MFQRTEANKFEQNDIFKEHIIASLSPVIGFI